MPFQPSLMSSFLTGTSPSLSGSIGKDAGGPPIANWRGGTAPPIGGYDNQTLSRLQQRCAMGDQLACQQASQIMNSPGYQYEQMAGQLQNQANLQRLSQSLGLGPQAPFMSRMGTRSRGRGGY